jgi:NAD(P)-dependent dehydrogenase (short-subunit alcohol dehydrogenase family)
MLRALGSETLVLKCDVTRSEDVKGALDKRMAAFGRLDAAFNNARLSSLSRRRPTSRRTSGTESFR